MTSVSRAQRGEGDGLRCRRSRRGVVLLEVVISISILLVAMAVIGLVFRNGQYNLQRSERITRAMLLTERLLAALDTGYLSLTEREQSGPFLAGAEDGVSWRIEANPDDNIDGLMKVDVDVFLGDPDGPEDEQMRILSTHVFRPDPAVAAEAAAAAADLASENPLPGLTPGGGGGGGGGTPSNNGNEDPQDCPPALLAILEDLASKLGDRGQDVSADDLCTLLMSNIGDFSGQSGNPG